MEAPAQETSEGGDISNWTRDRTCDSLMKNGVSFSPCTKNLPEAKLKSMGQISLAVEISSQPNTDSVTWLLVITLMTT